MELDSRVCSFIKDCCPRVVQLFCVGKVVLLVCLPPDLRFLQLTLLFSVPIGLVPTHTCIYTHVSHFAFNFTLNLYFRFRQELLHALLASSRFSKLLPARWHQSLPLTILCRGICPLQRSIENHVSCWSPVPGLALFFKYSAERWLSPSQISWASESQCFSLT